MNFVDRQIDDTESKIALLLREVKGTPIYDRAVLWINKWSGGRPLTEYLHDESLTKKDRHVVAQNLLEILLTKAHGRLPELPILGGDADAPRRSVLPDTVRRDESPVIPSNPASPAIALAPDLPPPDELRALVRQAVRDELAGMLELIARALRESK